MALELATEGFARLHRLVPLDVAAALSAHVDAELRTRLAEPRLAESAAPDDDGAVDTAIATERFGNVLSRTEDLKLSLAPPVAAALHAIFAAILPLVEEVATLDARLVELAALVSDPGAPQQPWHPATASGTPIYTLFVALQDVDEPMGPTRVLPRSHGEDARERLDSTRLYERAAWTGDAMCLATGDAFLMDSRLWHAGGANRSARRRRLLYLSLCAPHSTPAGSTYSLLDELRGRLKVRDYTRWAEAAGASTGPAGATPGTACEGEGGASSADGAGDGASGAPADACRELVRVVQEGRRLPGCDESGGWVWPSAEALEEVLLSEFPGGWGARRVLDLGAGTGWLSLRLACLGAEVLATDRAARLHLLLRNVQANQRRFAAAGKPPLRVEVDELDWEAPAAPEVAAPEVVVGTDLIYLHEMHAPLLRVLSAPALRDARIFLSWEQRKPDEEASFLRMAADAGFECRLLLRETRAGGGSAVSIAWDQRAEGECRLIAYELGRGF